MASLAALATPTRATPCAQVCDIFRHTCVQLQPPKLGACQAACDFDLTPQSCRGLCRLSVNEAARDCRHEARTCRAKCRTVARGPCTRGCATRARVCLRADVLEARGCLGRCRGGKEQARLECRESCFVELESGAFKCLRAAPVCIHAAKQVEHACLSACPREPFTERVPCKRVCKKAYRRAVEVCLDHPEAGLFACTTECAGSAAGAFVGLRPTGR